MTTAFDVTGFHMFGRVAAVLESGREPAQAEWDAMFSVPGYLALTASEFPRDIFADRIRLAYLPDRAADREAALAANRSALLTHFVEVRRRWAELEAVVGHVAEGGIGDEAVRLACSLLPIERLSAGGGALPACPPVSFLIFLNDARGYEPVVVDVLCASQLAGCDLTLLLAHEFHHFYRNRLLAFDRAAVRPELEDLVWTVDQIHAEGVADLINVPEMILGNGSWAAAAASYQAAVDAAPQYLARLNEGLERIDDHATIAAVGAELKSELPRSGHPIGYYIASTITDSGHQAELVTTVGDPLAFLELYNNVTKESGKPAFSDKAFSALRAVWERSVTR